MQQIGYNLEQLHRNIEQACKQAGRPTSEITLVAVTKTFPVEAIEQAIVQGVTIIGENRVQEAQEKFEKIGPKVQWHLIGHLQSNKAKKAVEIFSLIQSVDSVELAREIGRRALQAGKTQDVLLEVNTSGETQKYGFEPPKVKGALKDISRIEGVKVLGLMTVGPLTDEVEKVRGCFRLLRRMFDEIAGSGPSDIEMKYLSMGMSGDYPIAIEEGSNMIRVGSAIFGSR